MRSEVQMPAEESEQGEPFLVAEGVERVSFKFFDGEEWQPNWDELELPKGVEISLSLKDKEGLNLSTKVSLNR